MTGKDKQKLNDFKDWLRDNIKLSCDECEHEGKCNEWDVYECEIETSVYSSVLTCVEQLFGKGE